VDSAPGIDAVPGEVFGRDRYRNLLFAVIGPYRKRARPTSPIAGETDQLRAP
jgi:hypothetical protein